MAALSKEEWTRICNMRRNLEHVYYGPGNVTVAGCIRVIDKTADILGYSWDIYRRVYRRKNEDNG